MISLAVGTSASVREERLRDGSGKYGTLASTPRAVQERTLPDVASSESQYFPAQRGTNRLKHLVARHGHRDATLIMLAYRHGFRISELVALRWDEVDLKAGVAAREQTEERQSKRPSATTQTSFYESHRFMPASFEGMSGGGFWSARIARTKRKRFVMKGRLLSGVVFYQLANNGRCQL